MSRSFVALCALVPPGCVNVCSVRLGHARTHSLQRLTATLFFIYNKVFRDIFPPCSVLCLKRSAVRTRAPLPVLTDNSPSRSHTVSHKPQQLPSPSKSSPRSPRTSQDQLAQIEGLALGFSSPPAPRFRHDRLLFFPVLVPAAFILLPRDPRGIPSIHLFFGPERPRC